MTTVLTESGACQVDAEPDAELWLEGADAARATGWQLKPEGFCKGELCVPTPRKQPEHYARDGKVNLSAFWELMGKPAAATDSGDVWFLGEDAATRNDALLSLEAPDFTLPDFAGKPHSLTDFRRQRVLLITWASW